MTDAHETAQALRDLGRQARVTARALEALRVDELARGNDARPAIIETPPFKNLSGHTQSLGGLRGMDARPESIERLRCELIEARARCDSMQALAADRKREVVSLCEKAQADRVVADKEIEAVRAELADARAALEHERACRRVCENNASRLAREVERLKASEAASIERERKLTAALRVSEQRYAEEKSQRKAMYENVAALHGWCPSDAAVKVMLDRLVFGDGDRSAVRAGLRAAFVHDHFEAGEPRT